MKKQLYEKQSNQYNPIFPIVRLEDIIDTIADKSLQWIFNNYNHIYVNWRNTVAGTRNEVPAVLRRNGLWITYNTGKEIITEYYIGDNTEVNNANYWTSNSNWRNYKDIITDGSITYQHLSEALKQALGEDKNITNFPDEEDLTTDGIVLSFKDRKYEPHNFSGLGRVILRKNIIKDGNNFKNILTQDMINQSNTIYEIRYDFDLNKEEIIIPKGCVLDFQGGSLNNGILKGTYTAIKAEITKIFDVKILGSWNITEVYSEWFGGGTHNEDNSLYIQSCLNFFNKVNLLEGIYKTKYPIYVKSKDSIIGKGEKSIIKKVSPNVGSLDNNFTNKQINSIIIIGEDNNAYNVEIKDISFYAENYDIDYGIYINNINNSRLFNIMVFQCKYGIYCDGIFGALWAVTFDNITCDCNSLRKGTADIEYGHKDSFGFYLCATGATTCAFRRCWGKDTACAYYFRGIVKSTMIDCGADNISEKAYSFTGCEFSLIGCGMENTIISTQYGGIISSIQSKITFINFNTYAIKVWKELSQYGTYISATYYSKLIFINCKFIEPSEANNITLYPIKVDEGSIVKCELCTLPENTVKIWLSLSEDSKLIVDDGIGIWVRKTNLTIYHDYTSTQKGTSSDRPTNVKSSYQYFDTTLNKPIWWDGYKWVDATGQAV